MCATILDRKEDYDLEATQNMYIANMDNPKLIFSQVDWDHKSTNKELQDQYKNGSFPHTISQIVSELSDSSSIWSGSSSSDFPTYGGTPQRQSCPFQGTIYCSN